MQLCDKLCKKIFHSNSTRTDYEVTTEPHQIELISTTNNDMFLPTTITTAPSVNLIQPTPIQSPSKSSGEGQKSKIITTEAKAQTELQDPDDIDLEIHWQNEPVEPMLEDIVSEFKIEMGSEKIGTAINLENIHFMMRLGAQEKTRKGNEEENIIVDEKTGVTSDTDNGTTVNDVFNDVEYEDLDDNSKRLATKYGELGGELILLNLPNPRLSNCALGLRLSGNKNLNTMGVFICQIKPDSLADIDGRLRVGDEILEVDDHLIFGRSHLNASPIIKSCSQKLIKFVIHRSIDWLTNMAIPVTYRGLEDCNSNASSRRGSILDYLNDKDCNQSRKISCVSLGQIASYIPSISTEEAHTIYLNKGSHGFGFAIMEGSFTNEDGIFIKHIAPSGPAAQDGSFRPGDKLISINNQDISTASYETALELLKNSKGQVRLVVTRVRCSLSPTHSIGSPTKSFPQKRLSAPHITALPMINRPLSSTILEEKSEPTPHVISIKTIPESESGLTTLVKTMSDLNARRRSSLSNLPSADIVTMLMNHLADDGNVEVITIRRDTHPLGMSIIGGSDTFIGDVIVHDIFYNGVIANDGRIKVGDRILMINDISVIEHTNEDVITMLQSSCPDISLKIRHPDLPMQNQDIYEVVATVELTKKPSKGLGISVIGREGAKGVYIYDVVKGGVADNDGRLQPGDQLLEINGEDCRNSSQEEAATILKCLMGAVVFKIGRIQRMNVHYTPTYLQAKDENGEHNKSQGRHLTTNGPGHSPSRSPMTSPAHAR